MRFKIRRRKSYRPLAAFRFLPRWLRGLITINTSGMRITSVTNRLWFLSRNSRKPGRVNVDLPGAFRGELDLRKDEE